MNSPKLQEGCFLCNAVFSGCTSGFIEPDLLRRRAESISGSSTRAAGGGLDDEFRLLTDKSFSCSGNMTGILLVGAVRTGMNRSQYPEIQIWRRSTSDDDTYSKQAIQTIRLTEGAFSSDGVLQHNLNTFNISFQSGDMLGVYQPLESESVVRVYYDSNASTTYLVRENPNLINITNFLQNSSDELILISPISGIHTARIHDLYIIVSITCRLTVHWKFS